MIRKACASDIDAIEASYNAVFDREAETGSATSWIRGVYPTRETIERGVNAGTMYVYYIGGKLAASVILNSNQPAEYYDIPWEYAAPDEDVLVIHTLVVSPSMAGRGVGSTMVAFAEGLAFGQGRRVVRLDTNVTNTPAQRLYTKLGFRLAGRHHAVHEGVLSTELVYMEHLL